MADFPGAGVVHDCIEPDPCCLSYFLKSFEPFSVTVLRQIH